MSIVKFDYNGFEMSFDKTGSIMINATEMAKPFDKLPKDFTKGKQAWNFIQALARKENCPTEQIIQVVNGGNNYGTWMHQKLALKFAAWLSPDFELWVYDKIEELLLQGYTSITQYSMPQTYSEALRQLAESVEAKEAMEKQLEAAKPKIDFFNAVTGSKDAHEMGKVAKVLDMGIGRNKLFAQLRTLEILRANNEPYQEFIDRGYFRVIEQKYTDSKGETHIVFKTLVYQKGLDFIRKKILNIV